MINLLHAELFKIKNRKSFWICLLFVVVLTLANVFLHGNSQIDTMTLLLEIIGLMAGALFSGLYVGVEFSQRTIYHVLTSGNNRISIWISKYISYIIACLIILLINQLTANLGIAIIYGINQPLTMIDISHIILYYSAGIFYDLCLLSIPFFISMQIKEAGISIAVSTVITGIIIASSKILWVDRLFPLLNADSIINNIPMGSIAVITFVPIIIVCFGNLIFSKCDIV